MNIKAQLSIIDGPAGNVECRIGTTRPGSAPKGLAVICHPHSLHGGSMNNKVVTTLERAFGLAGWQTICFNFRSVGRSEGEYDEGRGEQEDLAAVVNFARGMFGDLPLALAGFSFGSFVAFKQANELQAVVLLTIAPPVNIYDFTEHNLQPGLVWSLIQGGQDEVVPAHKVVNWTRGLEKRPDVYWREDASHFFHGELIWLRNLVQLIAAS